MSRVLDIEVPESADDDWLREQLNNLNKRLEVAALLAEESPGTSHAIGGCLDIVDALQQYAGY